jgi:hypothetical protein
VIASALGLLVGIWDGFAGVFYHHGHPMSRSYALGHHLGRAAGVVPLLPGTLASRPAGVADAADRTEDAALHAPMLSYSIRLVPELRQKPPHHPATPEAPTLAQPGTGRQVTENFLHNLHTSRPE